MTNSLAAIAAAYAALHAAHHVADHWIQTDHQAATKGRSGLDGAVACIAHVATYTATCVAALVALGAVTGVWFSGAGLTYGLTVSAVTHYIADRRWPLVWLAERTGSRAFIGLGRPRPGRDDNPCLGTGAYALDQSWHIGWLFISALIIGGFS